MRSAFRTNQAVAGGGLLLRGSACDVVVQNSLFEFNIADVENNNGRDVYSQGNHQLRIANSVFQTMTEDTSASIMYFNLLETPGAKMAPIRIWNITHLRGNPSLIPSQEVSSDNDTLEKEIVLNKFSDETYSFDHIVESYFASGKLHFLSC